MFVPEYKKLSEKFPDFSADWVISIFLFFQILVRLASKTREFDLWEGKVECGIRVWEYWAEKHKEEHLERIWDKVVRPFVGLDE